MSMDTIIFFISAVVAVFGATMMISQRNPVASVLYMILSLVAQAVVYIQLSALFVGAMLVIVYAGAIMVLFLFVIMLLNLRGREDLGAHSSPISKITKYVVSLLLFVELVFIIKSVVLGGPVAGLLNTTPPTSDFGSVKSVSMLLFTKYLYPFELTGILLLIAVVGAVVIARRDRVDDAEGTKDAPETESEKPDEVVSK